MTSKSPRCQDSLSRRRLMTLGTGSFIALAGCTGGSDIQDSDGDGVIDSKDYAPRDKSVQERGDVKGTSKMTPSKGSGSSSRSTSTPTPFPTSTSTPTSTPTSKSLATTPIDTGSEDKDNYETLHANNSDALQESNYISSYSPSKVTVEVLAEDLNGVTAAGKDLLLILATFPRETELNHYRKSVSPSGDDYQTVEFDIDVTEEGDTGIIHLLAFFIDEDATYDDAGPENTNFLHESDPFTVDTTNNKIRRASPPSLDRIEPEETDLYAREDAEGVFAIEIQGRTLGKSWSASYVIYKSAYAYSINRDHGRSREEYVTYEMQQGFAGNLAELLADIANDNNITEKREQAEFVVDFIQRLPYVPDDVSTGYDDYTKYILETVTELGGDCEDTAIALVSVLQSEPFGYDMVLIQPPEHMAAGIYGTDLPGTYWTVEGRDYYYIETTGEGWGIGDLPEEFEDDDAYVHRV